LEMIRMALSVGFTGIGVKQHGAGRFIHLDDLPNAEGQPRPHLWSY
jgi:zinc D-Ala-D-Ala carboxypeptidase